MFKIPGSAPSSLAHWIQLPQGSVSLAVNTLFCCWNPWNSHGMSGKHPWHRDTENSVRDNQFWVQRDVTGHVQWGLGKGVQELGPSCSALWGFQNCLGVRNGAHPTKRGEFMFLGVWYPPKNIPKGKQPQEIPQAVTKPPPPTQQKRWDGIWIVELLLWGGSWELISALMLFFSSLLFGIPGWEDVCGLSLMARLHRALPCVFVPHHNSPLIWGLCWINSAWLFDFIFLKNTFMMTIN